MDCRSGPYPAQKQAWKSKKGGYNIYIYINNFLGIFVGDT